MQHLPSPLIFLALLTAECWVRPPISCLSSNRQHRRAFGALAALVNITVDDTSSEILYTPAESWHASTIPCSNCLSPGQDLAFQGTWHDGTHIIPTVDGDDINNQEGLGSLTSSLVPSAALPSPSNTNEGKHGDGDDDGGDGDEKKGDDRDTDKHQSKRKLQRREAVALRKRWPSPSRSDLEENPFLTPNLDSDDAGFVDNPVMAQFNFTGPSISPVYLF